MQEKAELMDERAMERALIRIAHEIIERNRDNEELCFIGIQRRGVPLAHRLKRFVDEAEGTDTPIGILDITFYRDDLSLLAEHPVMNGTDIPFSITGKRVVMVDDVLYTGRTARAAMDALMEMGRPLRIQLATLIDRGHRELPIRADYVGKNVPTSRGEVVAVQIRPTDPDERVALCTM